MQTIRSITIPTMAAIIGTNIGKLNLLYSLALLHIEYIDVSPKILESQQYLAHIVEELNDC